MHNTMHQNTHCKHAVCAATLDNEQDIALARALDKRKALVKSAVVSARRVTNTLTPLPARAAARTAATSSA